MKPFETLSEAHVWLWLYEAGNCSILLDRGHGHVEAIRHRKLQGGFGLPLETVPMPWRPGLRADLVTCSL